MEIQTQIEGLDNNKDGSSSLNMWWLWMISINSSRYYTIGMEKSRWNRFLGC
jgi:hypothetical protein